MKIKQNIIRDKDFNIVEYIDNNTHIKYSNNGDIISYKTDNFEFPPQFNNIESKEEQEFVDIVKDSIIKIDLNDHSIFLIKNEKTLFGYVLKYKYIWFNYNLISLTFNLKYNMNSQQIKFFLEDMIKKHFECTEITDIRYR